MTRYDPPESADAPDAVIPSDPRPPSLPVRITREVAVPVVAVIYAGLLTFLRFYDKLGETSYSILVATPVAGYIGSLVPKLNQDKNR